MVQFRMLVLLAVFAIAAQAEPDQKVAVPKSKPESKTAVPVAPKSDVPLKLKVAAVSAEAAKPAAAKVTAVVAKPAEHDAFPTDWMKSSNILKYDVDADPMANRIDSAASDAQEARTFNLKHVDLISQRVRKHRSAMEFLYVEDDAPASTDHCPKCGNLVCPHGFTAQAKKSHCCPYCVNPSVSTEVVKDASWYAANADPVMKKYR